MDEEQEDIEVLEGGMIWKNKGMVLKLPHPLIT